jgi:hypothetical protein
VGRVREEVGGEASQIEHRNLLASFNLFSKVSDKFLPTGSNSAEVILSDVMNLSFE